MTAGEIEVEQDSEEKITKKRKTNLSTERMQTERQEGNEKA